MKSIILKTTDLISDGRAVAKHNSLVCFIEGALDNETVEVEIVKENKRYIEAKALNILETSNDRTDPVCPVFGICGGCDLRHMNYKRQLKLKQDSIVSNFNKFAHYDLKVVEITANPLPDYYRNKADYKIQDGKIGFFAHKTHQVIKHDKCLLLDPSINSIKKHIENMPLESIKEITIKKAHSGCMLVLHGTKRPKDSVIEDISTNKCVSSIFFKNINTLQTYLLYGTEYITDNLCGLDFQISNDSFYQVNKIQAQHLYNLAKQFLLNKYDKQVLKDKVLLDLYCGIGTIALTLSDIVKSVIGVEIVQNAVLNAKNNAKINNIHNANFLCSDAKDALNDIDFDILVVDPPRAGLHKNLVEDIKIKAPESILYISCDSATLARDFNLLKDMYHIQNIQAVDMFTGTRHVECVVLMSRVEK